MGIGRFFKSIFNAEVLGEEIVAAQEKAYRRVKELSPGAEPHAVLAQVWLSRMAVRAKKPMDETMQAVAFSETMLFACVPPPNNARALGLHFINKERPDIFQVYPKFGSEFAALMEPVIKAVENGTLDALYQRYNPQMAREQ